MRELHVPDARPISPCSRADGNDHFTHNMDTMHSIKQMPFTLVARLAKSQVANGSGLALALFGQVADSATVG